MKLIHRVAIPTFAIALVFAGGAAAAMSPAGMPSIDKGSVILAKCGPNYGPECGRCKPGQRRECGKDVINGKTTYSCYCSGCPTAGCGR